MRRSAAGSALALLLGSAAALVATAACATTAPAVERYATVVFERSGIALAPRRVRSVPQSALIVVFRIRNDTSVGRRLVVGSYHSPIVPPGGIRRYSVAFVDPGPIVCRVVPAEGKRVERTLTILG